VLTSFVVCFVLEDFLFVEVVSFLGVDFEEEEEEV
jgi:hypothetical protein